MSIREREISAAIRELVAVESRNGELPYQKIADVLQPLDLSHDELIEILERLLSEGIQVHFEEDQLLELAAEYGDDDLPGGSSESVDKALNFLFGPPPDPLNDILRGIDVAIETQQTLADLGNECAPVLLKGLESQREVLRNAADQRRTLQEFFHHLELQKSLLDSAYQSGQYQEFLQRVELLTVWLGGASSGSLPATLTEGVPMSPDPGDLLRDAKEDLRLPCLLANLQDWLGVRRGFRVSAEEANDILSDWGGTLIRIEQASVVVTLDTKPETWEMITAIVMAHPRGISLPNLKLYLHRLLQPAAFSEASLLVDIKLAPGVHCRDDRYFWHLHDTLVEDPPSAEQDDVSCRFTKKCHDPWASEAQNGGEENEPEEDIGDLLKDWPALRGALRKGERVFTRTEWDQILREAMSRRDSDIVELAEGWLGL